MENYEELRREGGSLAPRASTLLRAAQRGDYAVLSNLLRSFNRDYFDARVNFGVLGALLMEASGREHLDCIELLLQRMATNNPKRKLKRRGCFPMHTAAGAGAIESIELLLSAGLSPKTRDQHGRTPLHLAAARGSAQCVAFLCVVARSTVESRDKVTGDTPLHFAVRARHGVCIEVLLSHGGGTIDILRRPNAKGETPFDVAAGLDDNKVLFWALTDGARRGRRRYSGSEETGLRLRSGNFFGEQDEARRVDGIGFERIMAVWEKFFENAAAAYGRWDGSSPGASTAIPEEAGGRFRGIQSMRRPENNGWWEINAQPSTPWLCEENVGQPVMSGRGGRKDETLSTSRCGTWTLMPRDLVREGEGEDTDGGSVRQAIHQQAKEHLRTRLGSEQHGTLIFSSHDTDLHLFHTPREDNDSETGWRSEPEQAEMDFPLEPLTPESEVVADPSEVKMGGCSRHLFQQTWVACWDASSESIYHWNSESGESSWDVPSRTISCGDETRQGFPDRVWDPQQKAFFTVDEDGVSRWLVDSNSLPAWVEDHVKGDRVADALVRSSHEHNSGDEEDGDTGRFYDAKEQNCRHVHPYLLQAGAKQGCASASMDDARLGDYAPLSSSSNEPRPPVWPEATASTSVINKKDTGGEKSSSFINIHDAERCRQTELFAVVEDYTKSENDVRTTEVEIAFSQLPAWMMWCGFSRDEDTTPYFVNEETGTSSWVLPPEAVVASKGWLRAWSEEHQTWFYANQWTGRVTWELQDLELEDWWASPDDRESLERGAYSCDELILPHRDVLLPQHRWSFGAGSHISR